MKRFKLLFFTFLIFSSPAFSQEAAVTFLFSSIAPCGTNTACVDVTTDDFSNVLYVKMPIKWDPKIVKLKEIKLGKLKNISLSNFNQSRALTEGLLFFLNGNTMIVTVLSYLPFLFQMVMSFFLFALNLSQVMDLLQL